MSDLHGVLDYRFPTFALRVRYNRSQLLKAEFCALEDVLSTNEADDGFELRAKIIQQLNAYVMDPNFIFDLPLQVNGTEHQEKIWQIMCQIPSGRSLTYGEVAKQILSAPRAVGGACGKNPFPVIIPCHRIIAANHKLGGFNSSNIFFNLGIKKWLLAHEGILF